VNRVDADFTAQNGKTHEIRPVLSNGCGKKARKGKGAGKKRR
jgi:hypothetical protein